MDISLRRNEHCVVGLPRCDYVFSSTRSCFIAYGFKTSALEVSVLKGLLTKRGIEAVEAGGSRVPGQNAFCAKICSKIIQSQFCIVLLNQDSVEEGPDAPNANVNMEYGLILGFNKYVIPFQRQDEDLPFNVAGLDTVKYDQTDFERVAAEAIDQALEDTTPSPTEVVPSPDALLLLLVHEGYVPADVSGDGEKTIYQLGSSLGFNLLCDTGGTRYVFLGIFTTYRTESVIWRTKMLSRAIDARRATWSTRVKTGALTEAQAQVADEIFADFRIWVVINSESDRDEVEAELTSSNLNYETRVITMAEVDEQIEALGDVLS